MGEKQTFQPLTREDRITVVLYRAGIALSAALIAGLAFLLTTAPPAAGQGSRSADLMLYGLHASAALAVFFIHLYIGRLKQYLKALYFLGLGCLAALLAIGKGSPTAALAAAPVSALLLLPLSGCLGFVAAKEAFCFRLVEGYILAMVMPACLLLASGGILSARDAAGGLVLIAALQVLFTLRKVFMPLAYDIGDKSAYR